MTAFASIGAQATGESDMSQNSQSDWFLNTNAISRTNNRSFLGIAEAMYYADDLAGHRVEW